MNLPQHARSLAADFPGLSQERKATILDHLDHCPPARFNQAVETHLADAEVAGFVRHVLGKDLPTRGAAPMNKKLTPPQTL